VHEFQLFKMAGTRLAFLSLLVLLSANCAQAEMGPCKDDGHSGLICGTGAGAARVIEGSTSPSKRLALAWRSPSSPPTDVPQNKVKDLVIRIDDGAILAEQDGQFWELPSGGRVNRLQEWASWSPNSRLMIRMLDERFDTSMIDLFVFDANDTLTGPFSLLKVMEPAVRARLKQRVTNDVPYSFMELGGRPFTIDNRGVVHAQIMMWAAKNGPEYDYDVLVQVTRMNGVLDAVVKSIRLTHYQASTE
jgi:hypothetical protein